MIVGRTQEKHISSLWLIYKKRTWDYYVPKSSYIKFVTP